MFALKFNWEFFYNEIQSHMWLEIFFKIITIFSRVQMKPMDGSAFFENTW